MAEKKTPKGETYRYIARAINRDPTSQLPPFPVKYYVDEPSPGIKLYLRESVAENTVEYVHEHTLANDIITWVHKDVIPVCHGYELEFKQAVEAARVWKAQAPPVGPIKSVCWQHDAGLTFRRLPWIKSYNSSSTFTEMFGRISNARALKCFIGSLFFDQSDMQQYVWLHGQGQNGKGALSRFLHRVFAGAYSSQIPPQSGDKFWTSMIMGKRLVVFPDCNNAGFVTSGLFKSLTGGDPVRVEQKGQPAGTAIMNAKYIFLSNERPSLSSEKADQRRIIYCEMGEVKAKTDPKYGEKLWAEGASFLTECIMTYEKDCENHGPIPVKVDDILSDWVSTVEEELEIAFERNFELEPASHIMPAAFQSRLQEIWPRNRKMQLEFIKWLERTHMVRKKTVREGTATHKSYPGLSLVYAGASVDTSQSSQYEQQKKRVQDVPGKKPAVYDRKNEL